MTRLASSVSMLPLHRIGRLKKALLDMRAQVRTQLGTKTVRVAPPEWRVIAPRVLYSMAGDLQYVSGRFDSLLTNYECQS